MADLSKRNQAALPSYWRTIVNDLYDQLGWGAEQQEVTELAMSELMERGQRFCVDFGVCNAVEMAELARMECQMEAE